jgi:tetratricopeptide (TPR) repeat protein
MMVRTTKWTTVLALSALAVFLVVTSSAFAQPRMMTQDVFTPLDKGFDLMKDGKYKAAEFEFKTALKRDRYNPFALNNLAAISAQEGKLKDAMAFLVDAQKYAKDYKNKYSQLCFTGGLCTGVKPLKELGNESAIAKIIAENMAKLKAKIAATPQKPVPSTPPPMEKVPGQQKGK